MITPISPITSELTANTIQQYSNREPSESISNVFLNALTHLDTDVSAANTAISDYIVKKPISTHELMIAMEEAKLSLNIAVQVRNKVLEAYETITRIRL
ncbi:flagellar hook-basal body complex protein FliE [Teredinibacter sp. KSP-S5-2]|uniref:flagellar hook-basal body complex protein FliE n=1 Tax=Teredinibacter sp. KSP-S5-2 TaxID=3034506 RepID=UPI002934B09A|nr:flagellar hook-basal body complex protein FliE [Teredinibacter sp. KSP-S5-2]WNO11341.1 flagellar hook-basal body complex protein FliE [Teredinibacter sp. KSP-S5-2]